MTTGSSGTVAEAAAGSVGDDGSSDVLDVQPN